MMNAPIDARVLIVDDDEALGAELQSFLASKGYTPSRATNVADARLLLAQGRPDLCLVDLVLPGTNGKVFCREVVERSAAAAVIMSAMSDEDTIVSMLEIGSDDYLVKPFGMREMLARIRAVLRRRGVKDAGPSKRVSQVGHWRYDPIDRQLTANDGFTRILTPGESALLRFLSASPGTVFSREDLLAVSRTRQHSGSEDRSVDNLIKRLRKKVETVPSSPRHIITVWGKGYRFDP